MDSCTNCNIQITRAGPIRLLGVKVDGRVILFKALNRAVGCCDMLNTYHILAQLEPGSQYPGYHFIQPRSRYTSIVYRIL